MRKLLLFAVTLGLLFSSLYLPQAAPPSTQAQEDTSTCRFNLKITQFRVLKDMGDGLFDGQMEVKVIISVSNGQLVVDRYIPTDGSIKLDKDEVQTLENIIFSLPAADVMTIEVLAIEVDDLPTIFGVGIDDAFIGLGNAIRALGTVGETIDGVIDSAVGSLRNSIAGDDTITDDTLYLYADDWWNAGETQVHVSADGNFEYTYFVTIYGCSTTRGA